jgi:hypothetical protein
MKARERAVINTNALVSRLLLPGSIPGQAVRKAVAECQPLASDDTIIELAEFSPAASWVTIGELRQSRKITAHCFERRANGSVAETSLRFLK